MKRKKYSIFCLLIIALLYFSGCCQQVISQKDISQYTNLYTDYELQSYPCKYAILRFSECLSGGFSATTVDGSRIDFINTSYIRTNAFQLNDHIYVRYREVELQGTESLRYAVELKELFPQIELTLLSNSTDVPLQEILSGPPVFYGETVEKDIIKFYLGYGNLLRDIEPGDHILVAYDEYFSPYGDGFSGLYAKSITKLPN